MRWLLCTIRSRMWENAVKTLVCVSRLSESSRLRWRDVSMTTAALVAWPDAIVLPEQGKAALVAAGLLDTPVPVAASLAGVGVRDDLLI